MNEEKRKELEKWVKSFIMNRNNPHVAFYEDYCEELKHSSLITGLSTKEFLLESEYSNKLLSNEILHLVTGFL